MKTTTQTVEQEQETPGFDDGSEPLDAPVDTDESYAAYESYAKTRGIAAWIDPWGAS